MAWSYPHIDPILLTLGPLEIRWYSLAYIAGFVLGAYLFKKADTWFGLLPEDKKSAPDDFMLWAILGVIFGGRLGYILWYQPGYYMDHPGDILKIWQGGMSFHGGLAGAGIAAFLFCRKHAIPFPSFCGGLALVAPIGLCFGRIANFINGELYGRVTESSWGMIFPRGGPLPRHPSQLYEAALEGIILGVILWIIALMYRSPYPKRPQAALGAVLTGVFLTGYAIARATVEQFREPDAHLGILSTGLTMGQTLSLPLLLGGAAFFYAAYAIKRTDSLHEKNGSDINKP